MRGPAYEPSPQVKSGVAPTFEPKHVKADEEPRLGYRITFRIPHD
jgi:hypothetical protein